MHLNNHIAYFRLYWEQEQIVLMSNYSMFYPNEMVLSHFILKKNL